MLDKIFFVSLILLGSGVFRFVAPYLGISIGLVTAALMGLNCLYLLARAQYLREIVLRGAMGRWLLLLFVWPVATMVYAPALDLRAAGLHFYFATLFASTVVYIWVNGLRPMYSALTICLVITAIGMPLSVKAPHLFEAAASLADARTEQLGRPIGFFLQPNRLAFCLCWLFIAWYALHPRKTAVKEVAAVLGFMGLVLATGSRGGVLVGAGVVVILLAYNWRERLLRGRLVVTGALLLVGLLAGVQGLRMYLDSLSTAPQRKHGDLIQRMESIISLQFSPEGSLEEDTSLEHRVSIQADYLAFIFEAPFLGRGLGANTYYLETGRLWLSAHSESLTRALEFGIFYPIVFWLAAASLYTKRGRRRVERALGTNAVTQFAAAFAVIFAYASVLEEGRVFCIVLAIFYALVQYPDHLFARDEDTGQLGRLLSRREVRAQLARRRPARTPKPAASEDDAAADGSPA